MSKIITNEMYINKLKQKNPDIVPCEEYIKSTTPIMHHCLKHDIFWKISPSNALKGKGCELCRRDKIKKSKKKTKDEYLTEIKDKGLKVIPLEDYCGATTPILHRCLIHNIDWKTSPSSVLNGCGCPKCKSDKIIQKCTKTNEQYIKELKDTNPNIIPLEEYQNSNIPILHRCLLDGYEWEARPSNLLNGTVGCPKCSQRFRRTNEDYINEVHEKSSYIESLEDFKGMGVPILHLCKKHNIKWKSSPDNILKGHGCKECGNEKIGLKNGKTHEQYLKEVKEINPNIIVLEKYIDSLTPIKHKCLIDNYEWDAMPSTILNHSGCPKCAGNIKYTTKTYTDKLKEIESTFVPLEDYKGIAIPILHKCIKHNVIWKTSPATTLQGSGCPLCTKEKHRQSLGKTHEQYIKELKEINPNVIPLEKYQNSVIPIKHKCLIDNYEWNVRPSQLLRGFGCPKCSSSKGEKKVKEWLSLHNINFEIQKRFSDCKDKNPLPFDFYLPDYNLCIEYQGKQHYEPINYFGGLEKFTYQQYHDELKKEYCEEKGISLLCIPYNKNIEEELDNFLFN